MTLVSSISFRHLRAASLVAAILFSCSGISYAASMTVVALGTSDTYGKGVARSEAYPARLQAKLKERGIDARVINAGVNGDASNMILKRLNSAVPNGNNLVLIEISPANEVKKRSDGRTSENISAIKSQLQARGIKYIDVSGTVRGYFKSSSQGGARLADGHLAPSAYESLAFALVSEVASALGK